MKLRNKKTGEEAPYFEGVTEFNPDIWELVEGEYIEPSIEEELNIIEDINIEEDGNKE